MMEIIEKFNYAIGEIKETLLRKCLLENAIPPIKEPITKNKIKWRGIRIIQDGNLWWIEQRGKPISRKVHTNPRYSFEE